MSNRLWREVEEILERSERLPRRAWRWRRLLRGLTALRPGLFFSLPRISMGQLLLASLVIIVIGYVLGSSNDGLGRALVLAGLGVFVLAFVLSLRRPLGPPESRWRGRPVGLRRRHMGERIRSWLGRWRPRH